MNDFPQKINVNDMAYKVIAFLGKGKGGYSYLVTDGKKNYTLKQIHHEPCNYYNFGNKLQSEINDYNTLIEIGILLPKMIDVDVSNERILKEYIDGDNIFDLVLKKAVKQDYINQIKAICKILYAHKLNIDYFPTNFIVQNEKLFYIDYECNNYTDEWNFENWGIKFWSRTPEFEEYLKRTKS